MLQIAPGIQNKKITQTPEFFEAADKNKKMKDLDHIYAHNNQ